MNTKQIQGRAVTIFNLRKYLCRRLDTSTFNRGTGGASYEEMMNLTKIVTDYSLGKITVAEAKKIANAKWRIR